MKRFWCICGSLRREALDRFQPLLPEYDRPLVPERPSATPTTPSEDELPFVNTMREFDTRNCDRGARE
jgi:hypothetical protein